MCRLDRLTRRAVEIAFAAVLMCGWVQALSAQSGAPPELEEWRGWALRNDPWTACPWLAGEDASNPQSRACAWPGVLTIVTVADGASFSQRWRIGARSRVTLPGDAATWPQRVMVDGAAAPVVETDNGLPAVWLEEGEHGISGVLRWQRRPQSLTLPFDSPLLSLTIDGVEVSAIARDGNQVRLGRGDAVAQAPERVTLRVFRKLVDGVPALLETRILLEVSGDAREATLHSPLPIGFAPTRVMGSLNARMDSRGDLIVQLRPGTHEIGLHARALAPAAAHARPVAREPWPAQEIWSFEQAPRWRIAQAAGGAQIDPAQAGVPAEWQALPAFLVESGAAFRVEQRSRGPSVDDRNRLRLARSLWLDFDGAGYTTRDTVAGEMRRDWRLEMVAPFRLTRAVVNGEATQVTQGGQQGRSGIELRHASASIDASARIEGAGSELPVNGWAQTFDAVETTLQLPPGYRLWAAPGADRAGGSWLSRWTLLAVFYVAVASLLAFWFAGWRLATVVAVLLTLSYEINPQITWLLAILLALALLAGKLPSGKPRSVVSALRVAALVALALLSLPFAGNQLRLAMYPQLEHDGVEARQSPQELDTINVTGSRIKRVDSEGAAFDQPQPMSESAPPPMPPTEASASIAKSNEADTAERERVERQWNADAVLQSGAGLTEWHWNTYALEWSGPVLSTQVVRLVVSPPWLTRMLRVLTVLLLALTLIRVAAGRWPSRGGGRLLRPAAAAGLLMLVALPALGDPVPRQEVLDQLREHAMRAPLCAPRCAAIARARVLDAGPTAISAGPALEVELHAASTLALPLPQPAGDGDLASAAIDGVNTEVWRREDGTLWIEVPRGVHRALLSYRSSTGVLRLRWPLAAHRVEIEAKGWTAEGIDEEGRLSGDTLVLSRVADATQPTGEDTSDGPQQFTPFVRVVREISFGEQWELTTRVERIAPDHAGFTLAIPLLEGESVISAEARVRDGRVVVAFGNDQAEVSWQSRLARAPRIKLTAPALDRHAEVWRIAARPQWSVSPSGLPELERGAAGWLHEFAPLPGETLTLDVRRPEAAAGPTRAIDQASLLARLGKRAVDYTLSFSLRSTRGDQHTVKLPPRADVLAVRIDGNPQNLRPQEGRLILPVHPGSQTIEIEWRENREPSALRLRTPAVHLGSDAANLIIRLDVPSDRWLLAASGPRIGPAVLYWPQLVLMALVAFALARLRRTPLRLYEWMLLGLGFSTVSWPALLVVVAWLLAIDWRARHPQIQEHRLFNLAQLGLVMLTLVALWSLFTAIQSGLLGEPSMHVTGNGSTERVLLWFHDRSSGAMPQAGVVVLPLLAYKIAMLAWALWLATALLRWLRWAVEAWLANGHWRREAPPQRNRDSQGTVGRTEVGEATTPGDPTDSIGPP